MAQFSNLTFDEIKENLKTYLENQDEFTDYDFEGSALNILLDELAYFGQYVGFYSNLLYQEGNLPTATKRDNVVTKARELAYFPYQKRSPQGVVKLSIDLSGESPKPSSVFVSKGKGFVAEKQEGTFNFVTTTDFALTDDDGNGIFDGEVDLREGYLLNYEWTFDSSDPTQRFIIPNPNIDERFITVSVTDSETNTTEIWNYAKNIVGIEENDPVFLLQEVEDQKIELEFTNQSNIGRDLKDGDGISVEYLVTKGSPGNNCKAFELIDSIDGYSTYKFNVETVNKALGGSDEENIDSIKQLAPINYMAQDRAVNINDYRALLLHNFPYIKTMNVWGGEDHDPPKYGQVMISLKPDYGLYIGENIKEEINKFLNDYSVVGVRPQIIDPEYIFLDLDIDVFYDGNKTSLVAQEIKNNLNRDITEYFNDNILKFEDVLWQSHLTSFIDNNSDYIISSRYEISINRKFTPTPNVANNFTFKFVNSLIPNTIISNTFGDGYELKDDGNGNIDLYQNDILLQDEQGTVDYDNSIINLQNFEPKISKNETIELNAVPKKRDVFSRKNFLLNLENVSINLNSV